MLDFKVPLWDIGASGDHPIQPLMCGQDAWARRSCTPWVSLDVCWALRAFSGCCVSGVGVCLLYKYGCRGVGFVMSRGDLSFADDLVSFAFGGAQVLVAVSSFLLHYVCGFWRCLVDLPSSM
jgi:hypothetical protein